MGKVNNYLFFLSVMFLCSLIIVDAEVFGYGRTEEVPLNYSLIPTVNSSNYWGNYYYGDWNLASFLTSFTETDPRAYNGTLAYASSLNDYWKSDGTSTVTGQWNISINSAIPVVNGGFTADTDWTKTGSCAIQGGMMNCSGASAGTFYPTTALTPVVGRFEAITFTITTQTGGKGVTVTYGGLSSYYSGAGTYTLSGVATSTANLLFSYASGGIATFNCKIDNIMGIEWNVTNGGAMQLDYLNVTKAVFGSGVEFGGAITAPTFNALNLTSQATGFKIAGGTTSKTLTLSGDSNINQDLRTTTSPTFVTGKFSTGWGDTNSPPMCSWDGDEGGVTCGTIDTRDIHWTFATAGNSKVIKIEDWANNVNISMGYNGAYPEINLWGREAIEITNSSGYASTIAHDYLYGTSISSLGEDALSYAQDNSELLNTRGEIDDSLFRNAQTKEVNVTVGYKIIGKNEYGFDIKEPIIEKQILSVVSGVGQLADHEQMLFEANQKFISLEQENQMLKDCITNSLDFRALKECIR